MSKGVASSTAPANFVSKTVSISCFQRTEKSSELTEGSRFRHPAVRVYKRSGARCQDADCLCDPESMLELSDWFPVDDNGDELSAGDGLGSGMLCRGVTVAEAGRREPSEAEQSKFGTR